MKVSLEQSIDYCSEVSKLRAKNFYYGMKLVPPAKRAAQFALYAWMRLADDLADDAGSTEEKVKALTQFQQTTDAIAEGSLSPNDVEMEPKLWPAVAMMIRDYNISEQYLHDMIAGQLLDQQVTRYKTFDQLYDYCYKVASVVGLCCIEIWGYEGGEETRQLAEWRGIAFQLTNILRDVMEDAHNGRVYLPAKDFDVFQINPSMFTLGKPEELVGGLKTVIDRATEYYRKSEPLDDRVNCDGQPCLWAMTQIYRGLLNKIEKTPTAILKGDRIRLSSAHKGWIAMRAMMKGRVGF